MDIGGKVLHLTQVPMYATKLDIVKLFESSRWNNDEHPIPEGTNGIHIVTNYVGTPVGEAFVSFGNEKNIMQIIDEDELFIDKYHIRVKMVPRSFMEDEMKEKSIKSTLCLIMKGLNKTITPKEIKVFLSGMNMSEDGVLTHTSNYSLVRRGDAYVKFGDHKSVEKALKLHLLPWGNRLLEVYKVEEETYQKIRNNISSQIETSDKTNYSVIIYGLPFQAGVEQIAEFFNPKKPVRVDILINCHGWPSGNCIAYFSSGEDLVEALKKNGTCMSRRYLEIKLYKKGLLGYYQKANCKMPLETSIHLISTFPIFTNKSIMGKHLFRYIGADSENVRRYKCGAIQPCQKLQIGRNMKFIALVRRLAKL